MVCGAIRILIILTYRGKDNIFSPFEVEWKRAPDDVEYGPVGGILGRGSGGARRKPAPELCPLQIPYCMSPARTRVAAVGSRLLTARSTARPENNIKVNPKEVGYESMNFIYLAQKTS